MLNYLKAHGAGLMGIIACRSGADRGCMWTIREKWAIESKLVLVLTDEHIKSMLRIKEASGRPEDVVLRLIEEFRLSM